jgi:peptidyl-prolyl cis-trans isomerase SurA
LADDERKMTIMHVKQSINGFRKLICAAMIVAAATASAAAQNVAVLVNGEPITALDIEQRQKFIQISNQKSPPRESVINELIDEKLKVREGKRWGIELSDADINNLYSSVAGRMHLSPDQLTQQLAKSGVNANTLKDRIRAENVWTQLVRGRYQASMQLSDKEVDLALEAKHLDTQEVAAVDYIMRPILLLVPPSSQPAVFEGRRKEAEALRSRFRDCQEGIPLARALRDTAVRNQIIRSSADLPEGLRKVLDAVPVGQLTEPEVTKHGVEMYAICGKQASKSDSPTKRQAREAVLTERFEAQSKRYLARLRREALIEHK